jgi:hypothetical protein
MAFEVRCSHCRIKHTFLDSLQGQEVQCKNCKRLFIAADRSSSLMEKKKVEDGWAEVRPVRKSARSSKSDAAIPLLDGPTDTGARFSIAVAAPPREQGGQPEDGLPKAKHRRGLVYTPERVDLDELREGEAAGDYSGVLMFGMAGVAGLTMLVLVVLVFFAAFYKSAGPLVASGGTVPAVQPPPPRDPIQAPVAGQPRVKEAPVLPDRFNPPQEVPGFGNMGKQSGRAPTDMSRKGVPSFGFDGASPRPWYEKTPAQTLWEEQHKDLKVSYLSDLQEEVTAAGRRRFAKNGQAGDIGNHAIQVQGRIAPKGLGVLTPSFSYCAVRYALPPGAQYFKAWAALNDSGPAGLLEKHQFEVLLDGKTAAVSRILSARGDSDSCTVNISGAKTLELRCYCLDSAAFQHAVWLEPRLYVRQ